MINSCPITPTSGAFLSGMLSHIDCQAQTIGAAGYQALAYPGSATSIALTTLLTIFVALFGLRMVLGQTPDVRDGVMAAVKVGIVLVLATSWSAYRTVAYDVVLRGPAEIVGTIGVASGLPGAGGGMTERLQNVDDLILYFASVGSGPPLSAGESPLSPIERTRVATTLMTDSFAFAVARTAFLIGTIGSLAIVRLGAGILLALAPLFAGFLLFEATRDLFFGWLRALFAVAIGALAIPLILGVELAIVEPWLADVLSRRAAAAPTPVAPSELLTMILVFVLVIFAVLALCGRLTFALHTTAPLRGSRTDQIPEVWSSGTEAANSRGSSPQPPLQSRATAISDAMARAERREGGPGPTGGTDPSFIHRLAAGAAPARPSVPLSGPVGHQFRRARPRVSAGAHRRDR